MLNLYKTTVKHILTKTGTKQRFYNTFSIYPQIKRICFLPIGWGRFKHFWTWKDDEDENWYWWFSAKLSEEKKNILHFSFWQTIFQHFLVSDNVPVTPHLWCYLGDNLQLGHDCKHWRAIVMFPVIFEKHSSRPVWLFLWLAFTSIYKFSTCFMTQADTRNHVAVEGQIKDGNAG